MTVESWDGMKPEIIMEVAGQLAGVVAVILGFVSFQMKTRRQILFAQIGAAAVFCVHYALIGAASGMVLNAVAVVRTVVYSNNDKKIFSGKYWTVIFAVIMGVLGLLSWQAWYSVFTVAGMVINTVCMSLKNPQNIRRSILVTSPLVLIYNCFVFSLGGIVYETVAIVSAAIGLIRFYKKRAE